MDGRGRALVFDGLKRNKGIAVAAADAAPINSVAEAAPIKPFVISSSRSSSGSLTVAVTGKRVRLPAAHRTILIRCFRLIDQTHPYQ